MSTRLKALALAGVAVVAVSVLIVSQAPGKKHSHGTIQVYASAPVSTPAGSVGSGVVFCPPNTAATGGGEEYVTGVATVEMGFRGNAYGILVDNFNSSLPSQVNVQVACTAGTTRARGRELPHSVIVQQLKDEAAAREAAYRRAEK